jgi:hypothetical protein
MDYSRAWVFGGFPLPNVPLPPNCKTIKAYRYLNNLFPNFFVHAEAYAVLDKINLVSATDVSTIISQHPANWLTDAMKNSIISWWSGPELKARTGSIRTGIQNGSVF